MMYGRSHCEPMTRGRPLYVIPGSSRPIFTQTDVHATRCSTSTHVIHFHLLNLYPPPPRLGRLLEIHSLIHTWCKSRTAVIFSPDDWWFTGLLLCFDISLCGSAAYYGAHRKSSAVIDRRAPDARDPLSALRTYTQHHNSGGSCLSLFYFIVGFWTCFGLFVFSLCS